MEPVFLALDEVLLLHQRLINEFGGSPGVRDLGLLQSALAVPSAAFAGQFLHDSIPAMAAAYVFHLVKNHPFVDGNKRIGAAAARVFVLMNDLEFAPPEEEFEEVVLAVARGEMEKSTVAEFFRRHIAGSTDQSARE